MNNPAPNFAQVDALGSTALAGANKSLWLRLLAGLLALTAAPAFGATIATDELAEMSLEDLANIRVMSVSKRPESLADAPASIVVITGDEIRRAGATTLPEALRLAPNLQVARVDARNYAITARGFNSPFENKLLVLIDGRTVYSPLFSGVYWDAQDVVLEDVDHIEVISGAGATLWGANAVNGVINIISKSSANTQGALAVVAGSANEKNAVLRYGGTLGNGATYRLYGKYADNDDTLNAKNFNTKTGWRRAQVGFRSDWSGVDQKLTLQGDTYSGALHQFGTPNITIAGANLLGRGDTKLADGSDLSLQAYWDYTQRKQPGAFIEHLHTVDLQLQHATKLAKIHDIVWGAGYRLAIDKVENANAFAFLPGHLNMHWGNVFVQDEISLSDRLRLTAGLKLEDNNYTGIEWLPTLRLSWKASPSALVWSSLSRSARTPSRIDRDLYAPTNPKVVDGVSQYAIAGGPDFTSEVGNTLELGYRAQPTATVSYSITGFYDRYDKLRTLEPNPNGSGSVFRNGAEGNSRGLELRGSWQALPAWRLTAGFVTQCIGTTLKAWSVDQTGATGLATSDPDNYWTLRSSYDIAPGQELDLTLRHSGRLDKPLVPSYTALDLRYGWKIRRDLELSLVGQNLLAGSHAEYGAEPGRSVFDRSLFVKLVWRQ
ncbi:MAG: TonB-dependent receptor [Pseudomonadota bacterium]